MALRFLAAMALTVALAGTNAAAQPALCGGIAGLACRDDQWCDYPQSAPCGAGDRQGTCRPRPEACTREYVPVCGCNGETYGNACDAAAAGISVAHAGACRSTPQRQ